MEIKKSKYNLIRNWGQFKQKRLNKRLLIYCRDNIDPSSVAVFFRGEKKYISSMAKIKSEIEVV